MESGIRELTLASRGAGAATPQLLRRLNAGLVLDALRGDGAMSVTDLVAVTGLSRPTVDAVAGDLVRLGWLVELAEDPGSPRPRRGRPARRLVFRANAGYVVGVDIGEHKVRAAVADLRGDLVAERCDELDDPYCAAADRLKAIRSTIAATLAETEVGLDAVLAACVGCTGGMDDERGEILYSSALPPGFNLRRAVQRALGPVVAIENDCNLAVLGERWRGVAADVDDVICLLASERMGAGIMVGGRLVRGHAGAAGELAFVSEYEPEYGEGARGVAYLARSLGAEAVAAGVETALAAHAGGEPERVDAELVFAAARAGDPVAMEIAERSVRHAGHAIITMAEVLNPELVVIGGGVARAGEIMLEPLRRELAQMARFPPRLEASALAERGVLVGAIRHALDHLEPRLLDGLRAAA